MTEQLKQNMDTPCASGEEDGINLLDYWRIIWKRRKMIGWMVTVTMVIMTVMSLFMAEIYRAKAVIIPVAARDGGVSGASMGVLAQQFGGLPVFSTSTAGTALEVVSLLNSNILKEKVIQQHNLLPILFYKKWDAGKQAWKPKNGILSRSPFYDTSKSGSPAPAGKSPKKDPNMPDAWDALRLLDEIVMVSRNSKENTITISADFHDPELAARIVDCYLVTLTDYMSSEVKRVASANRKYLEEQLGGTTDPFIKQKTYNLIAQQIETGIMAEVKENFAFKVIDPPLAPDKKIKPKRGQIILLAAFLSLFIGVCAAFFLEYLDKIKTKNRGVGK